VRREHETGCPCIDSEIALKARNQWSVEGLNGADERKGEDAARPNQPVGRAHYELGFIGGVGPKSPKNNVWPVTDPKPGSTNWGAPRRPVWSRLLKAIARFAQEISCVKSSLMRALTGSHVFVAEKLFATLDTTVRALWPESRPRILVSDTVGFIKKLPHDLVASFRSTLDEALETSLLLQIVDAADPVFRAQMQVTREVLEEIGAGDVPWILVPTRSTRSPRPSGRSC